MTTGPHVLLRLSATAVVAYCSYAMCRTPLLPLFASALGAGPSAIGFVMGASTLTGVLLKLPAGALSDAVGRHRLLLAAAIVFAVMPFTYLGAGTIAALMALRFVHGSATAIFSPVAAASVSDLAPADRRGAWLGAYSTAQAAGQAVGPVIAGYLIAAGRFDLAFAAAGTLGLAVPFLIAGWRGPSRAHAPPPSPREMTRAMVEAIGNRAILATSGAQAAQFLLNGALSGFLPLFARDAAGLTAAQTGWLFAVQTLTVLAVRPLLGAFSDRAGRRGVIVAGLATCSASVLMLSAASSAPGLFAAVMGYAAGAAATSAAASAFITDAARGGRYGAAHGVFGAIYDVGDALGPVVTGLLVASAGYVHAFRWLALAVALAAAAFAFASRARGTAMIPPR